MSVPDWVPADLAVRAAAIPDENPATPPTLRVRALVMDRRDTPESWAPVAFKLYAYVADMPTLIQARILSGDSHLLATHQECQRGDVFTFVVSVTSAQIIDGQMNIVGLLVHM